VGGPPSSFRAEAAALDLLLDSADPDRELVVLLDSLSLIRTLQAWDRVDFFPIPDSLLHKDVLTSIVSKLSIRSKTTILVKVKSHTGVPMNEEADYAAELGRQAEEVHFDSDIYQTLLTPCLDNGNNKALFHCVVDNKYRNRELARLRAEGALITESLLYENKGQALLGATRKSLPESSQRRMLQLLGGVFPCGLRSFRMGKSPDSLCVLGCATKETPSHILCGCRPMKDAITAAHDKIWQRLYDFLVSHSDPASHWSFDSSIGTMNLPPLSCSLTPQLMRLKPDAICWREEDRSLYLLDFLRTSDFWSDSIARASERKLTKQGYSDLLLALQSALPGWNIQLLEFALGDRGFFPQSRWLEHLQSLKVPAKHLQAYSAIAVAGAYEVVGDILRARQAHLRMGPIN
jgi:hypothetical protein